jgi:hypothetical protein
MRAAFHDALDDIYASFEGARGIKGTPYQGTVPWQTMFDKIGVNDVWGNLGPPPLHFWAFVGTDSVWCTYTTQFNPVNCGKGQAGWQENFLLVAISHAVELQFDGAKPTLAWLGQSVVGQMTDPNYEPALAGQFVEPTVKKGPSGDFAHFQNYGELKSAWSDVFLAKIANYASDALPYWPASGAEIYWDVARGGIGTIADKVPNGLAAWQRYNAFIAQMITHTGQAPNWNNDPTWAILPRVK